MKRTLFMHIPKTAGTSVLGYLRRVYADYPRLELRHQDNSLQSVNADAVKKAANIWLHEPLHLLPGDVSGFFKFTFLRDPLERVGSLYAYLRDPATIDRQDFSHTPEYVVISLRKISRMSFEDFILSEDPIHTGGIASVYPRYFESQEERAFASKENYLKHCIERMDQCFDLIGDTSQLSEDMRLIHKHCFPWYASSFTEARINKSKKEGLDLRLSSSMEERLETMLALDYALFREGRSLRLKKRAALEGGWRRLFGLTRLRRHVGANPEPASRTLTH